jgi:hypothetical protein
VIVRTIEYGEKAGQQSTPPPRGGLCGSGGPSLDVHSGNVMPFNQPNLIVILLMMLLLQSPHLRANEVIRESIGVGRSVTRRSHVLGLGLYLGVGWCRSPTTEPN